MSDPTYTIPDFGPADLLTSDRERFRRMRVDVGQTGFFEGREFRTFREFSIASGASLFIKFTSPVDFVLFEQSLTVDAGAVRFTALTGATEATPFNTALPVIGKNRMAARPEPFYVAQVAVSADGAVTGGTAVEVFRVLSSNATAQQSTVGGANQSERGLPAGTYYLRIENIGNGAATGVYSLFWEERPA